jgi:hypothetical protein
MFDAFAWLLAISLDVSEGGKQGCTEQEQLLWNG